MRKIRVLFFESGRRGGSIFRLRSVLERTDRDRFEAGFVSYYSDQAAATLFRVEGLFCRHSLGLRWEQPDVFKHPFGLAVPTPFALYYFVASLVLLWRHRPSVVYMNTGIDGHQPAIWAARLLGVPVVCHIRTSRPLSRDERRTARRVQRFVACTRWGVEHYRAQLARPAADVSLVYDGIDLDEFDTRAAKAAAPPVPEGALYVCQVGSLIPRKRPRLAVEAVALARQRCPELRLVLAGDGPLRDELARLLSEADLAAAVVMAGHSKEIPALLRRCSIGLLVSEHEGLPNAVMEYMAAGLPVVAALLPGLDELVMNGRTGLIVEDPTPARLAESLLQLALSGEKRAAFGAAARKRIEEGPFGVDAEARAVEAVLARAVGEPAAPS